MVANTKDTNTTVRALHRSDYLAYSGRESDELTISIANWSFSIDC